jgi:hypothetical protein
LNSILSSLSAFLVAGVRPKTSLARAIALVLVIKLIGIVGMKIFMFPDSAKPVVDATTVARVLEPSTSLP